MQSSAYYIRSVDSGIVYHTHTHTHTQQNATALDGSFPMYIRKDAHAALKKFVRIKPKIAQKVEAFALKHFAGKQVSRFRMEAGARERARE
jgi:hypothetical protein